MLNIGLAIAVLIVCGVYKSCPTLDKRTAIKVMTIILTVTVSLKLITLAGISSAYYATGDSSYAVIDFMTSFVYGVLVIYYGINIILGIIACIFGYKAIANNNLTQSAYKERQTRNEQIIKNTCVNYSRNEQMHFTTAESSAWQCGSCGKYNEAVNKFCIYCGSSK